MESCDSDRSSGAMILYADCVALRLHADGHARSSRLAISIKSSASIIVGFVLGVRAINRPSQR